MKLGIVSLYGWLKYWDNYGTLLQNYALQEFLRKHGHDTYWIRTGASGPAGQQGGSLRLSALHNLRRLAAWPLRCLRGRPIQERLDEFKRTHPRHFGEFMQRHVPHTREEYTMEGLLSNPPEADAYIVGSDQVWREVTPLNFLAFGSPSVRRIAYGASAPWVALPPEWYEKAKDEIERFHAISVREVEGLAVCGRLGRPDAVHVVDPTLLLDKDDYATLVAGNGDALDFGSSVVLGYFVNVWNRRRLPWKGICGFAGMHGAALRVIPLQGAELIIPEENVYAPSPIGWIDAFAQASFVLTNSYHGALFAIIMRKPFLALLQSGSKAAENSRFTSALRILGLESRMVGEGEGQRATAAEINRRMSSEIDWASVETRLDAWRQRSGDFLLDSLARADGSPTVES